MIKQLQYRMTTFYDVVSGTIKKNHLRVQKDLFTLCDAIADLPLEEKENYELQISDIIGMIPTYMLNSSLKQRDIYTHILQSSYRTDLFVLLHNIIFKIDHKEKYRPMKKENLTPFQFTVNDTPPILKLTPQVKIHSIEEVEKEIQKTKERQKDLEPILLEWHNEQTTKMQEVNISYKAIPEMINAIRDLIISIRRNMISSQVSEFILLFEDINKVILSEHPDQTTISTLINECLKENGWFSTRIYPSPDKTKLIKIAKDLHHILELIA